MLSWRVLIERAMWLMDQQYRHYERLMLVAHNPSELEAYRPQAEEIARFCARWGMRLEQALGSDGCVRQLVERARLLAGQAGGSLQDGLAGCDPVNDGEAQISPDGDFLIIPPDGEIRQELFVR